LRAFQADTLLQRGAASGRVKIVEKIFPAPEAGKIHLPECYDLSWDPREQQVLNCKASMFDYLTNQHARYLAGLSHRLATSEKGLLKKEDASALRSLGYL
jgi:hypothetical protein